MQEHFKDIHKMQDVLLGAQTGLWAIEIDEDRPPRLYADSTMLKLLGLEEEPSPEVCYEYWYERIDSAYYPIVNDGVSRLAQDIRTEVQYPWMHPYLGQVFIRCGGVRDNSYTKGLCLRGYHQNITDTVILKNEYEAVKNTLNLSRQRENILSNLCQCYYSIYVFDLDNDMEQPIWQEKAVQNGGEFSAGTLSDTYEKFIQEYVYPEDQEKMRKAGSPEFLRAALSEDNPVYDIDFRRVYSHGIEWVRSRFSISEIKEGRVTKVIFANMNIHEQKLQQLKDEERKKLYFEYQNILKGLSSFYHSVIYVDMKEDNYQAFKMREDLAEKLNGTKSYSRFKDVYSSNFIHQDDKENFVNELSCENICRRIMNGETIYFLEYRRNYGSYYGWMRMHIILAESQNNVPVKIILAAHNVEKEKEMEEKNKKALLAAYEAAQKANEAKSNFLAQMSHDIRTPMNAIIGMTAIACQNLHNPEKIKDCLNKIDLSSKYLLSLINDILDMSKIEKGKIELVSEPFSLTKLMEEVEAIVKSEASEKELRIQFNIQDLVCDTLIGDSSRIRQVLINLTGNAVKYTPMGGTITVTAKEACHRLSGECSLVLTVEDNGIGMDKEFLDFVFVPFAREDNSQVRHIQGTGLGMSIANGLVTAMQGSIIAESEKGSGTRFVVTLNLKAVSDGTSYSTDDQYLPFPSGDDNVPFTFPSACNILVAEDNSLNMEIVCTFLRNAGLKVSCAANGQEAFDTFISSPVGTYDAILMDLQMPVMDGYTAARKIRSCIHPEAKTIPIIALTANAFTEDIAKTLAAGMNDHVSKPINYQNLIFALSKYLNK
ncbi:MAG: ATP-binding protein [Eubacteriales bacterium]|nr:ATP-binding protein [Eubacteriales bacterium]